MWVGLNRGWRKERGEEEEEEDEKVELGGNRSFCHYYTGEGWEILRGAGHQRKRARTALQHPVAPPNTKMDMKKTEKVGVLCCFVKRSGRGFGCTVEEDKKTRRKEHTRRKGRSSLHPLSKERLDCNFGGAQTYSKNKQTTNMYMRQTHRWMHGTRNPRS